MSSKVDPFLQHFFFVMFKMQSISDRERGYLPSSSFFLLLACRSTLRLKKVRLHSGAFILSCVETDCLGYVRVDRTIKNIVDGIIGFAKRSLEYINCRHQVCVGIGRI